jgi:hypothetical protein
MPVTEIESWTVLADDDEVVEPVERFLTHLTALERSPNTVRAYAFSLKLWFEFLDRIQVAWTEAGVENVARFVSWLRAPAENVIVLKTVTGRCTSACPELGSTAIPISATQSSGSGPQRRGRRATQPINGPPRSRFGSCSTPHARSSPSSAPTTGPARSARPIAWPATSPIVNREGSRRPDPLCRRHVHGVDPPGQTGILDEDCG